MSSELAASSDAPVQAPVVSSPKVATTNETGGIGEGDKKALPVEMNTFAQFNIDSSNPVCYPYICRFNLSRLALVKPESSAHVYVVVKLETSKRTLRSAEVSMLKNNGEPVVTTVQQQQQQSSDDDHPDKDLLTSPGAAATGIQTSSADLNMNYSITYPFFPKKDTNILYFYIQQRKKYKNRTILGYKTIAYASVDLAAADHKQPVSRDLPLLARSSRRAGGGHQHQQHQHRSSSVEEAAAAVAAEKKQPIVGYLTIKSLVNQSLETTTNGELSAVSVEPNSLNNFISKNRQLKMLRKELKLLKSKTQLGVGISSSGSQSSSSKKKERSKSEKLSGVEQATAVSNTIETTENTAETEQQASTVHQLQLLQQQQVKIKKPKFKLSLNRRSHAGGFTFSDSDEQDPGPGAQAAVAASSAQPVAMATANAVLTSSHGKKFSTINAIRKSIINSGNNFASNSNAHKNARKLTGRLISFIRKLRNESDENEPDGEIEYDENELFNYEEVYNLCKKQREEENAAAAAVAANAGGCSALYTEDAVAGPNGGGLNDESEYEPGEEEVFDSLQQSCGNQLHQQQHLVHHSHMNLLKDQINNIILNDYSNYNDDDFDLDDDDLDLNYDLDNIEQISDGFSNMEDVTADHQDVYSIISTPKPKLLPFFTKSQQELNYKFILEEYQAAAGSKSDQQHLISISNSKLLEPGQKIHQKPAASQQASPKLFSDFKSPAKVSLTNVNVISDLSNDQKLDKMLKNLTEKRPLLENEYLFLLIDEADPLCHVLAQRAKRLENLSYHEITASSAQSLSEFKLAFYRVLAWLLKNETILINHAENFYFKVLLVGNDQHVNRYLQAFVDMFKLDNEFIYLKYFKHYFVPSNLVSLNSTVKLASVISLLTTADQHRSPNAKNGGGGGYRALFGDKYWFEIIRKKRIVVSHGGDSDPVDTVYNEVWSRISRYLCAPLPNAKPNLPSSTGGGGGGSGGVEQLKEHFGRELKLHIGQVTAVYYGHKFAKLQLPFLVDVKIGALREFSSSHFSNFDLIDCLTGGSQTSPLAAAAMDGLPSIFQFDSSSFKKPMTAPAQQRTSTSLDVNSSSSSLMTAAVAAKSSLAFKMSHLSPKDKNRFNSLSNMSLQIDYSFYESVNLSAAKLINSMSVHSMSSVISGANHHHHHPSSLPFSPSTLAVATAEPGLISSSATVSNFGDADWQSSSLKSNVKKASYKYIQIYRTNLLFSKEAHGSSLKANTPSSQGQVSAAILSSNQMLNSLSMIHVTKEKKQKIMRLGKKTKDEDQRIEFVDGLVKIVCKASRPSSSSQTNGSHANTATNPSDSNNSSSSRFQSPIKISVDGIEYNSIKYLQVSSQWQTNTELNDLNANFNKQSASKHLKYISFVVL